MPDVEIFFIISGYNMSLTRKTTSLKRRILIPLTLALVFLLSVFVYRVYLISQEKISEDALKKFESVNKLFEKKLESDAELISAVIETLAGNKEIQAAWSARDRPGLIGLTSPVYAKLRAKYRITHFYFHDLDRVTFLRVYNPEKYGDVSRHSTLLKSQKSGKPSVGIEIGSLGTLTLRVVYPWLIDGRVVGYLEMGEEIEHIIKKLREILGVELYVSIYKNFTSRSEWEKGMRIMGHEGNWEQFSSLVVVGKTLDVVPDNFADLHQLFHEQFPDYQNLETPADFKLSIGDRVFYTGFIYLFDSVENEVGDIMVLYDVTEPLDTSGESILLVVVICAIVGEVLFILFSTILGRAEKQLEESRLKLIEETNIREDFQKRYLAEMKLEREQLRKNNKRQEITEGE